MHRIGQDARLEIIQVEQALLGPTRGDGPSSPRQQADGPIGVGRIMAGAIARKLASERTGAMFASTDIGLIAGENGPGSSDDRLAIRDQIGQEVQAFRIPEKTRVVPLALKPEAAVDMADTGRRHRRPRPGHHPRLGGQVPEMIVLHPRRTLHLGDRPSVPHRQQHVDPNQDAVVLKCRLENRLGPALIDEGARARHRRGQRVAAEGGAMRAELHRLRHLIAHFDIDSLENILDRHTPRRNGFGKPMAFCGDRIHDQPVVGNAPHIIAERIV